MLANTVCSLSSLVVRRNVPRHCGSSNTLCRAAKTLPHICILNRNSSTSNDTNVSAGTQLFAVTTPLPLTKESSIAPSVVKGPIPQSSTVVKGPTPHNQRRRLVPKNAAFIAMNNQILELGGKQQWEALLEFADQNATNLNNVNVTTILSQLGRIKIFAQHHRDHPLFHKLLRNIAERLEVHGLPWIQVRQIGSLLHALGKLQMLSLAYSSSGGNSTLRILQWITRPRTAYMFVQKADTTALANVTWAMATLEYKSNDLPHLFAALERRAHWFIHCAKPQEIANVVWAIATLECASTNGSDSIYQHCQSIFRILEQERAVWFVQNAGRPQEIANVVWAYAKLGIPCPNLIHEVEGRASWLVELGQPQNVANTLWACATLQHHAPRLLEELATNRTALYHLCHDGTPQAVANTAWAVATLGHDMPFFFDHINKPVVARWLVNRGKVLALSTTAWACATLGHSAPHFFEHLQGSAAAVRLLEDGGPQEVANTLWAFAKLGHAGVELVTEFDLQALSWIDQDGIQPQSITNAAWACATIGHAVPNFWVGVDRRADWLVKQGTPQEVANVVWAVAKSRASAPNLLKAINEDAVRLLRTGTSQNISNMAWSLATLGFDRAPQFFKELQKQDVVNKLLDQGSTQSVANTAWACATLGYPIPRLFESLNRQADWFVLQGLPQEVSHTVWACAKLNYQDAPTLFAVLDQHADDFYNRQSWSVQSLTSAAWACAALGYESNNLFALMDREAEWVVCEGESQNVANATLACASLGYESNNFFAEIEKHIDMMLEQDISAQFLANMCFATSIAGQNQRLQNTVHTFWNKALDLFETHEDEFVPTALIQLAQVQMLARPDGLSLTPPPQLMTEKMILAVRGHNAKATPSQSALAISFVLNEIGLKHKMEVNPDDSVPTMGGLWSIDLACPNSKIAIEYDGITHFLRSPALGGAVTTRRDGTTQAKRRYLQQLGWTVVSLDYRDFAKARRESRVKQWLYRKLQEEDVTFPLDVHT